VIIRCGRCGRPVGSVESYSYGGPDGEDHVDYGKPEYFENYGGDHDGDGYCEDCLPLEEADNDL
jgi:hypothetical protein